jgi:hypothetical protein
LGLAFSSVFSGLILGLPTSRSPFAGSANGASH